MYILNRSGVFACGSSILMILAGCKFVTVPPASADAAPVVSIIHTVTSGSIAPPYDSVITGQGVTDLPYQHAKIAYCKKNTALTLIVTSRNGGGVKDLSISIKQLNGQVLFATSVTAALDGSGRAPDSLTITGGDPGGVGALLSITVTGKVEAIFVEVDSHNFNNQETHFVGEYYAP